MVVRGGRIWTLSSRGRLRLLASGSQPSWSPDGTRVAFARTGWIWVARLGGGGRHRVIRGSAPVWSPDGLRIAYLAPGGLPYVVDAGGGYPRRLGSLPARSLDWQPLPRTSGRVCRRPDHSVVVARDAQAVVWSISTPISEAPGATQVSWYGCLRAVGRVHLLDSGVNGGYLSASLGAKLAGRYAAVGFTTYDGKYDQGSDVLEMVDLSSGRFVWTAFPGCPSQPSEPTQCLGGVALADTSGFAAWSTREGTPTYHSINAVSCPSVSLCVAADDGGRILTSTNPTGGRPSWAITNVTQSGFTALSCPSTGFCAAVSGGDVFTSTDPTGGPSAWSRTTVGSGSSVFTSISCPSAALCVAANENGEAAVSADPTAGPSAWRIVDIDGTALLFDVTCPATSLCVAGDSLANVVTTTNPTGDASAWSRARLDHEPYNPAIGHLVCPSTTLCMASASDYTGGNVFLSNNPAGGAGAWTRTHFDPSREPGFITCSSASFCVGFDNANAVLTSANPAGGAGTWQIMSSLGQGPLPDAMSCPSTSLCVAAYGPAIISSTNPGGSGPWNRAGVDIPDCALKHRVTSSASTCTTVTARASSIARARGAPPRSAPCTCPPTG